ncbi:hypothetical protein JMUB6875_69480 [Nocardia sp. JMUB6875]|uniref:hypothetical protein n=1 Tax=Nocardia sp. JMUB6875 TaxID=3158170 RepID=UPI0032E66ED0
MDLEAFDAPEVLAALSRIACTDDNELVLASAGESLAGIWIRNGRVDWRVYEELSPAAKSEVDARLKGQAPQLLPGL